MESHFYNVELKWVEDRKGRMSSPELMQDLEVATPPEFAKGISGIWSPEHLLTAAVNSCLMTTFLAIADNSKLEFSGFHCSAKGKLELIDGKYLMSEVLLEPVLMILHPKDLERAKRILQKSESACLISNSIKSKITMTPKIILKHDE